jgi:hypothetical protein
MFKITDDNYQYYKKVYITLCKYTVSLMQVKINSPYTPDNLLDSWEKKSKSLARRGVKEGLKDMLTVLLVELSPERKTELSNLLISQELPSLNHLVSTIKDTPQKVLKRGKIKNLDEYYVVKEFLDALSSDITATDRESLEEILVDFETD